MTTICINTIEKFLVKPGAMIVCLDNNIIDNSLKSDQRFADGTSILGHTPCLVIFHQVNIFIYDIIS